MQLWQWYDKTHTLSLLASLLVQYRPISRSRKATACLLPPPDSLCYCVGWFFVRKIAQKLWINFPSSVDRIIRPILCYCIKIQMCRPPAVLRIAQISLIRQQWYYFIAFYLLFFWTKNHSNYISSVALLWPDFNL